MLYHNIITNTLGNVSTCNEEKKEFKMGKEIWYSSLQAVNDDAHFRQSIVDSPTWHFLIIFEWLHQL